MPFGVGSWGKGMSKEEGRPRRYMITWACGQRGRATTEVVCYRVGSESGVLDVEERGER